MLGKCDVFPNGMAWWLPYKICACGRNWRCLRHHSSNRFNFFIFVYLLNPLQGENELSTYVTSIVIYSRREFSTIGRNYRTSCKLFDMQLSVTSIVTCPRWDISTITVSSFFGTGCFQGSPSILIYTWSVVPWWNSNRTLCACARRVPWPCGASKTNPCQPFRKPTISSFSSSTYGGVNPLSCDFLSLGVPQGFKPPEKLGKLRQTMDLMLKLLFEGVSNLLLLSLLLPKRINPPYLFQFNLFSS